MLLQQTKGFVVRGGRGGGCRGILSSSSSSATGKQGSGIRRIGSERSNLLSSSQRVLSSSRLVQQQQLQVEAALRRMISTRVIKPSLSQVVATATMTTTRTTAGVDGTMGRRYDTVGIGNKNYYSSISTIVPLNEESYKNISTLNSASQICVLPPEDMDDDGG